MKYSLKVDMLVDLKVMILNCKFYFFGGAGNILQNRKITVIKVYAFSITEIKFYKMRKLIKFSWWICTI